MHPTAPLTGEKARQKILSGITKVHEVVAPTLGPAGRSVLLPRSHNRGQRAVDDGYYAAENVILKDPHEKLAADFLKEAIAKSNAQNGDGTTGTEVLAYNIVKTIFRDYPITSESEADTDRLAHSMLGDLAKNKGTTVRAIRQQIKDAGAAVIAEIKKAAKPVGSLEELERIALISIGKEDVEAAKLVAKMVWEVCRDAEGNFVPGFIDVTDGFKGEIETETVVGMKFPAKVPANGFVNRPERHEMVAEDVKVLLTNHKIDSIVVMGTILDKLKEPKLAIFAPDFSNQVLILLYELNKKGALLFPIKCPALRTTQLEDLAAYTATRVIDKEKGQKLESITKEHLGFAEKIVVKAVENREDATLLGGKGSKTLVHERIALLQAQLKEARNDLDKGQLEKRISNLSSAGGTIRVGSSTEGDSKFIKMKIEDGVYACRGALESGYVKGGGLCLKEIAETLPENILTECLKTPYEQIQKNAGGIDIGDDVIDPAKVVVGIVEHAVSVAANLITVHAIVPEIPEPHPSEGNEAIAKAIRQYAMYWAKHQGLIKGSEDLAEEDRNREFERVLAADKD